MPRIKCKNCGKLKPHKAHGLCGKCYGEEYSSGYKGKRRKKLPKRGCLRCERDFIPEHENNHICSRCTEINDDVHFYPAGVSSALDKSI